MSEVPLSKGDPPVEVVYHCTLAPETERLAMVAELQKVCDTLPVGGAGIFIVTVTFSLDALSHELIV